MNGPFDLLHFINVQRRGGSGEAAARLCLALHHRGHRVSVITTPTFEWTPRLREAGLHVIDEIPLRFTLKPRTLRCIRDVKALIRERGFDIVHAHRSTDHWVAAASIRGLSERPVLIRTRHIVVPLKTNPADRWLYQSATQKVIAVAGVIEDRLRESGYFANGRIVRIPGSIEIERFRQPCRGKLRELLGLDPGVPLAGMVARFAEVKGHIHLLDAARGVVDRLPEARFVLIGDGGLRETIEQRIEELGLADNVHLLGWRSDVEELIADLDVYVLASVGSEGSSRATLEAMAARLPVVATTVGMLPEVVEDGVNGRLVPPADPEAMAQAVLDVLQSPTRREMGEAGRRRVEDEFSLDRMVAQTEAVYAEALAERRSPPG